MEKTTKTGAQIYGYTVCIVSVITFLICISTLMNAFFDLQDPLHAGYSPPGSPSLVAYDNYRMDILKNLPKGDDGASLVPDDQTLRTMYEAAREDKITSVKNQARRAIVISLMLIAICIALFIIHWRWLKKMNRAE